MIAVFFLYFINFVSRDRNVLERHVKISCYVRIFFVYVLRSPVINGLSDKVCYSQQPQVSSVPSSHFPSGIFYP